MGLPTTQTDAYLNTFRATDYTGFTAYVALFDGDPQSGGTEITNTIKGSTTLNACGFGAPAAGSGSNRRISNSAEIEITASAAGSADATHFAIYDATTTAGGTLRFSAALDSTLTINTGNPVKFEAAALYIEVNPSA